MNDLALPLSFVGLPDWHVIQWVRGHPIEAEAVFLAVAFWVCVAVLAWAILSLEVERHKRRRGK